MANIDIPKDYINNQEIDIVEKLEKIKNHIVGIHHQMDMDYNIAYSLYSEGITGDDEIDIKKFPKGTLDPVTISSNDALLDDPDDVIQKHTSIMNRYSTFAHHQHINFNSRMVISGKNIRTVLSWSNLVSEKEHAYKKQDAVQRYLLPLFERYCKDNYGSSPLNQFNSLHSSGPLHEPLINLELQKDLFNDKISWEDFCEEMYTYQMELGITALLDKNKRSRKQGDTYIPKRFQNG